jgi:LPS export ABC transporter protein LptC
VLKNVKATFYPEGKPVIYVEGREGRLKMDSKDMVIRGDVVVRSEAGYALKTEELRYHASKKQVDTDQPVEMAQDGLTVKGVGLSANIDGESLTVWRDVKATFQ